MSILTTFNRFDRDNPEVWRLFQQYTYQIMRQGLTHYSADAILHRIRWHAHVETSSMPDLKINNNYSAAYARKFEDEYPHHMGFFRLRTSELDRVDSSQIGTNHGVQKN